MENHLANKIRQLRELKGFSQEYIAIQLGISQRAYSKLETNQTRLDWLKITKIAQVLDMDPVDLISFDDNQIFNKYNESVRYINQMPEKLIEQYERQIERLENDIVFLKEQLGK